MLRSTRWSQPVCSSRLEPGSFGKRKMPKSPSSSSSALESALFRRYFLIRLGQVHRLSAARPISCQKPSLGRYGLYKIKLQGHPLAGRCQQVAVVRPWSRLVTRRGSGGALVSPVKSKSNFALFFRANKHGQSSGCFLLHMPPPASRKSKDKGKSPCKASD